MYRLCIHKYFTKYRHIIYYSFETLCTDRVHVSPTAKFQATKKSMAAASMTGMQNMLEICQDSPEQDFVGRFKRYLAKRDLPERMKEIFEPKEDGFNTLCHGDLWFNNILFK